MDRLPDTCDLNLLGLVSADVTNIKLIHEKHENRLYRIKFSANSFVLKWFANPAQEIEIRSYKLLKELGAEDSSGNNHNGLPDSYEDRECFVKGLLTCF